VITVYSVNFPSLAALLLLVAVGLYHLWASRRQEFDTVVLPSTMRFDHGTTVLSIQNDKDVSVNCVVKFDHLVCRNLHVGPKGSLEGRLIQAERILVEGELKGVEHVVARVEVVNRGGIEAILIDTPRLTLERRSMSVIQIVPKETEVARKRGAQTRGFFSSADELDKSRRATLRTHRPAVPISLLRKTGH
jgi:cytoskeletal protein CcmA (bactofilin family)